MKNFIDTNKNYISLQSKNKKSMRVYFLDNANLRGFVGCQVAADWKTTYYIRDAQGNPMATYSRSSQNQEASYKLIERPIYGSSRVGIDNYSLEFIGYSTSTSRIYNHVLGLKQYELSNHLGNVLTTISDKKFPVENNGLIDYYVADITSVSDYYPFGSPMDGRTFGSERYRFGFQGQEAENEISGIGNYSFFKYRISDNRLGRFFAIDPLADKYPYNSAYAFSENRVIDGVELNGLEYYRPPVQRYGYNNMLNNRPSYGTINRYSYTPPTQRIQQSVNNNYFVRYSTPGSSSYTDPQTSTGVSRVGYISLYLTDYLSNYTTQYKDKIINQSTYTDKVSDVEMTEKINNQSGKVTRQFQIKFFKPSDEIAFLKEQSDWMAKRNDAVSKIPKPQKPTDKTNESMKQYMDEMFIYKGRVMITESLLGLSPAEKLVKDMNSQRGKYKLIESSPIPTIRVKN